MMESRARVLGMINASWTTQVISVACELGLPELIAGGQKSAQSLADAAHADADAVHRLLRALVTLGLCVEKENGAFELSPDGELLRADGAGSLSAWARMSGQRIWANWTELGNSVRTGESARKRIAGVDDFSHLDLDLAKAAVFNAAMVDLTRPVALAAARDLDWSGVTKAVDVGGGVGELIATVLTHHPEMRAVVFDLEHAVSGARTHLERAGVADRCDVVSGSFFEAVPPGADAYLLKSVLHNWDDERAVAILRNCAAAMKPGGRIMLFERLVPERLTASPCDQEIARSDLNMLVGCDGRERTQSQFDALVRQANLVLGEVRPLSSGFNALVAAAN
jgi:orsellinic acid C2-O-methyltransferase